MKTAYRSIAGLALALLLLSTPSPATAEDPGVYLRLAESVPGPVAEVSARLEEALAARGWTVLAAFDAGVPTDCPYHARVIVAYPNAHRASLLEAGSHAAYALPVRYVVYEDETGTGIGATNPMNLYRTIVDEDTEPEDWAPLAADIRAVVAGAFPDHTVQTEYGKRRGKSRIGRTFGIMAGGPFVEKFKEVVTRPADGATAEEIAASIERGLRADGDDWEWQIRPVYVLPIPEHDLAVVGVRGGPVEARSAEIVGAGGDDARKDMACPGIDHAAAYPMEVVVRVVEGELQVRLVDVMFRTKIYFEDAGTMAFATNMGMPGSIEDEVKDRIRAVLAH